jgi:HEPN domain-containing protein
VAKAERDLSEASWMLGGEGPYDTAFFNAQQAIEKDLNMLLAFHAQPIPRSHDLDELKRLVLTIYPHPELAALDLAAANDYIRLSSGKIGCQWGSACTVVLHIELLITTHL